MKKSNKNYKGQPITFLYGGVNIYFPHTNKDVRQNGERYE